MRKNRMKKLIALCMVTVMCAGFGASSALAALPDTGIVAPQNIAITVTENLLEYSGTNKVDCYGATSVQHGYNAGLTIELQMYTGTKWETIKTWTASDDSFVVIDETYTVDSRYDYRLKLTHRAYDSNWNLIETIVKYSDVV